MNRIAIVFLLILLFYVFLLPNEMYHLKVEIKTKDINPIDLDENFAKNIEKDILNLKDIKDVIIFSSIYGINIYCKFNRFANKENTTNEIQRVLIPYKFNDLKFNDKYYKKYNCFFVVHSQNNDYHYLKNKTDVVLNEILKLKISSIFKVFGLQQETINIYLTDDVLLKYDLSLTDIRKIIKDNNLNENLIDNVIFNSKFKTINDIKNILISYKDSNFAFKFDDVFEIKNEIKNPIENKIYWNNNNALIIAASKKWFYPFWYLKLKFASYGVEIINPNNMYKSEVYLANNSDFAMLHNTYLNIQKNNKGDNLYFLALEAPKVSNVENFDEIKNNRIIVFSNNFKYKNDDKIFAPVEITGVKYSIDDYKLKKFGLLKRDVANFIVQSSEGVYCDYFYIDNNRTEIYLKNKSDFIYSKKMNSLISKNEVLRAEIDNYYNLVVRKNLKRIELIKIKNPSILRRVKFQIR